MLRIGDVLMSCKKEDLRRGLMKIVVVGLGYVGLSNAVLLAQHNDVIGVDISQERVDALNARQSPIIDAELSEYLAVKDLHLSASTDLNVSVQKADYVIVSTPTNYDEKTNFLIRPRSRQ